MEIRRAQEIMRSLGVIDVNYNGIPVWIEDIKGEEAQVNFIGMGKRMELPISELTEADPI